jgi:hypothetical protein
MDIAEGIKNFDDSRFTIKIVHIILARKSASRKVFQTLSLMSLFYFGLIFYWVKMAKFLHRL